MKTFGTAFFGLAASVAFAYWVDSIEGGVFLLAMIGFIYCWKG